MRLVRILVLACTLAAAWFSNGCLAGEEAGLKRLFLHAHSLRLEGAGGEAMDFNAPLPEDLRAVLSALE